jgi:hypothetical protein
MHYLEEHQIFLFLVQVAILLGLARAFAELFKRISRALDMPKKKIKVRA